MKAQSIHRILVGITALALVLLIGSPYVSAQKADSDQISNLLTEAKTHAVQAEDDSATLESFTRSNLEWRSHAIKLEMIKTHVNEIGKLLKQMTDLSSEGSPWQQEAIRQIDPLLRSMADNLTSTIEHLNANQSKVHMPPYRDYVHANFEFASRTAEMIRDFVDYDKAKARADALEQKLEIPSTGQSE
ncbi:MAG: hypothetical protein KGM96_13515 [Acidobacteriota bacterium]|nr:hypothetical protein [Acidobacteriota bacterium]